MAKRIHPKFHLEGSRLIVGNTELKNYRIIKQLGDGANGIVYHAINELLQRPEAVKIWRTRNPRDRRNKVEQGLREAQKLAQVSPEYAVTIYGVQEIDGLLIATMEYVDGKTLEWYQKNADPSVRIGLAAVYLGAIVQTTTAATRHGDAHAKNVLVYEEKGKYESRLKIKLCDFGTSLYSGREASEQRHWRIVRETVLELTRGIRYADSCLETLDRLWPAGLQMAADAYKARERGIDFSDQEIAQFWSAPLRDYINDLRDLNLRP